MAVPRIRPLNVNQYGGPLRERLLSSRQVLFSQPTTATTAMPVRPRNNSYTPVNPFQPPTTTATTTLPQPSARPTASSLNVDPFAIPNRTGLRMSERFRNGLNGISTAALSAVPAVASIPAVGIPAAVGLGYLGLTGVGISRDNPEIENPGLELLGDIIPLVGNPIVNRFEYTDAEREQDAFNAINEESARMGVAEAEAYAESLKQARAELENRLASAGSAAEIQQAASEYMDINQQIADTYASGLDGQYEPMTGEDMIYETYDPNGTVYQGMNSMAEAEMGRHRILEADRHRYGMEYSGMNRQSEQAMGMLNFALGDRNSHRSYLASLASNINYQ